MVAVIIGVSDYELTIVAVIIVMRGGVADSGFKKRNATGDSNPHQWLRAPLRFKPVQPRLILSYECSFKL